MSRLQQLQRKPISFDTTIRNPERLPYFLSILKEYEGQVLTYDLALEIEAQIIIQKIFEPTMRTLGTYAKEYNVKFKFRASDQSSEAEKRVSDYFEEWKKSSNGEFPLDKMLYLLNNTVTSFRQDSSMPGGWISRFYTQFAFANELGLVHTEFNEKIKFSKNGNLMIHDFKNGKILDDYSDSYETSAFLIAFSKYQINNPYRSNTIKVNFFTLVLKVIQYLDKKYDRPGIHREDITFIIAWGNNDHVALAEYIYKFRNKFGYKASEETIYEYAMNIIDESTTNELRPATQSFINKKKKHYKFDKLTGETRDEVVRKLRMTRLVSLRGAGRFIDINSMNIDKVDYILNRYFENINFDKFDAQNYLDYMGEIDNNLIYSSEIVETELMLDAKQKALHEWSEKPWEFLHNELIKSSKKVYTDNLVLKEIQAPTRFEFLVAIVLQKALKSAKIHPNYIVDDQGIPYSTASGQKEGIIGADIDIFENNVHALAEPTISYARSFQVEHEIPSVQEHILSANEMDFDNTDKQHINEWFGLFIAPKIVSAVGNRIDIVKQESGAEIFAWEAKDFGEFSKTVNSIRDYKITRSYAVGRTMKYR
ncbi:AlwI family type II restriction endonuclease [Staphylococcus chromogenes]|uniref:AlwI family type II restriction endonuclease n=1 Tax=Staphylococcus chromogenes TaxID=46126 RepID=UPI0028849A88|nr:AlwI family type II restriction endonuclease [Staphylococcus chromogenes]MDT0736521.1 AlwI family type II restriction endonuclease [Staphylococcus chromogenes]MDT0749505.1 AlwI family type II restriction endonuclease [Staphylococcus chromogenes]